MRLSNALSIVLIEGAASPNLYHARLILDYAAGKQRKACSLLQLSDMVMKIK
jgi:hypothetical protein